jgi:hypothetical protein
MLLKALEKLEMHKTMTAVQDEAGSGAAPDGLATQIGLSRTGINPLTWMATDFLNQYNEIAMMLENIDAWPEGLLDLKDWRPLDYEHHFARSGLSDSDLVITAFQHAPDALRKRFELIVADTNSLIERALQVLLCDYTGEKWETLTAPAAVLATEIRAQIMKLRRLINVENTNIEQDGIDDMFSAHRMAS